MKRLRTEQTKVDEAIEKALEKFVSDKMTQAEKDIFVRKKEQQRVELEEQVREIEQSQRVNEATIEYVCNFIRIPAKLWRDSDYETRQIFQQMMFPNGLIFDIKEQKFGTDNLSVFYRLETIKKEPSETKSSHLVIPAGVEPAIFWMRTRRPGPLDDGTT